MSGHATRFGHWLARRGPFVRGMVYGLMLIPHVALGALAGIFFGWLDGIENWRIDRDALESMVARHRRGL